MQINIINMNRLLIKTSVNYCIGKQSNFLFTWYTPEPRIVGTH